MSEQLDIRQIRIDGGTQSRITIDPVTVDSYSQDMKGGAEFPPIIVFYDGKDHWLADGFHRVEAAKHAHLTSIQADVRQGTRRDAVLHSVGANATHGLRRTRGDKQRAVETLLRDPEWQQWADREIGRRCHVDHKTVANIRRRLVASGEIPQIDTDQRLVERNGATYSMDTSSIGAAAKEPEVEPDPVPVPAGGVGEKANPAPQLRRLSVSSLEMKVRDWLKTQGNPQQVLAAIKTKALEEGWRNYWHDLVIHIAREWNGSTEYLGSDLRQACNNVLDQMQQRQKEAAAAPEPAPELDGDEWYTPADLIELARLVMGEIDLDPASCPAAQKVVQAAQFFTKDSDPHGLSTANWIYNGHTLAQNRPARIWLNPPYSWPLIEQFINKLLQQIELGYAVAEAIVLTNSATDTEWWQRLAKESEAILFHKGRVKFWQPGRENGSPRQAQTIFYLGPNVEHFKRHFGPLGYLV